ncbi:MAG: 4Fe-4S dicluster domain-containing protein [Acidobacteria bacterium]|nr:4Fe-4S dicluster domain-containing protein [Acidobacteriota bacterium]MBI3658841.1 4Fe-4S dicluster domain-containing protein [Acidobacteriota bacterium]
MPKWGMVIDLDKCTGCQACVVACKTENNIPFSTPEQAEMGRTISWIEIIPIMEGEYPRPKLRYLPRPCLQCDHPPCIKVCPVYATYRNPEGLVGQVYSRCIGCRYCTAACPYTAKYFNWSAPTWAKEFEPCLNPDVSKRPKGVVEKCTFCHHRLQKAKEKVKAEGRELKDEDYVPACVQTCPAGAMYFGDLDNPNSKVTQQTKSPRAFRLLEELGTEPKVIYLTEGEWHGAYRK